MKHLLLPHISLVTVAVTANKLTKIPTFIKYRYRIDRPTINQSTCVFFFFLLSLYILLGKKKSQENSKAKHVGHVWIVLLSLAGLGKQRGRAERYGNKVSPLASV